MNDPRKVWSYCGLMSTILMVLSGTIGHFSGFIIGCVGIVLSAFVLYRLGGAK